MSAVSNDKWLEAVAATFASYRRMIDGSVSQLSDVELHQRPSPGVNSVAVILRHLSGNLLSRWTDFLITDGEKPDRDRDREFTDWEGDRDSLLAYFDSGWAALTKAIGQIDAANMDQPVFIRGERHSIADALLRSLTHLSYHVGQIALIARLVHQGEWRWLTIPPGQSTQHNLQTWGTAASRSVFGEGTISTIDQPEITRWTALDETPSPSAFIEYLNAVSSLTAIQRIKQQTFDRLQAGAGDHLLDVGCGAGDDVRALAQRVGNTGRVVGFEVSATMIEEARRRSSGLNLPIEFCLGDADRLDFPNETFTGCRIDRVLVHLDDPLRTLSEMVRVLRPGGRLVAFDFDWETLIVDAPDRALTRRLLNFFCDQGPSRWIGRQLRGLCSSLALTEIDVAAETLEFVDYTQANRVLMFEATAKQAVAAGLATEVEAERWLHGLEQSHAEGRLFAALTGFCVSGRKPVASAEPSSFGEHRHDQGTKSMQSPNAISIVSYDARYQSDFKRLNEAWIREYFEMEETDHKALDHPEQYIIASGGEILFAIERDTVVGTCALIRTDSGPFDFELAKMAVDPRFRGRGIGQQLGAAIIERARRLGAKTIFLESNTILAPAISLYRKLGFVETERQPTTYARGNIHMVLKLDL